ncbi:hypothetical protein OG729_14935 [Streptomyces sp. NBC_00210]|uniref:hypothetical protein n=1 Tax=unclassified Streptomyces TaxID=2593676 RepID=UPI003252218C
MGIYVNGVLQAYDEQDTADTGSAPGISQEVSTILELNAGDVISLTVFQNSGSPATSLSASNGGAVVAPQLQAEWQAP